MEEENGELNPESGRASTKQRQEEEDRKVVKFLDSADSYLDLSESLSSILRQVNPQNHLKIQNPSSHLSCKRSYFSPCWISMQAAIDFFIHILILAS